MNLVPNRRNAAKNAVSDSVSGAVERVVFQSEESGFCVLRVKARGHRDLVALVGNATSINPGEWVTATGKWVIDSKYGPQFRAESLHVTVPTSISGIRAYLGSGMIRGIGKVYAGKLVDAFGDKVFDVIEAEPERLGEIYGIGPYRAKMIADAWAEQKAVRDIMVFLHEHGVGTARAVRIYKTYGADAIAVISANPYVLATDIRGIGFKTADAIAMNFGITKDAMIRIRAGLSFVLSEAMSDGNCGLVADILVDKAISLLEVEEREVEKALATELDEGVLIGESIDGVQSVFLSYLFYAETGIASGIQRIASCPMPWRKIETDKAIPWVESKIGIRFSDSQAEAVRLAVTSKFLVITGGPGVGKTTIVNAILRILLAVHASALLCAPTGRAAKRMAEATGCEAVTIHRLLGIDPGTGRFRQNERNPLECDLLIVDETSMVDVPLMNALLKAVPDSAAVILVGDIDQLPSVGPGKVLSDIIESESVPVIRLTEVFRQAAESQIILNAHAINSGKMPNLKNLDGATDFYFVAADEPEEAAEKIVKMVSKRIPSRFGYNPVRDVQVICPMNRGTVGAQLLNLRLQTVLNPVREPAIERFGWSYAAGDKVMQVQNDYEKLIFNGDIGVVLSADIDTSCLIVEFDGREIPIEAGELDALVPAYAITVHKSQGSEYPVVVMPVMTQHYIMLQRNLLYTGITRGKRLVVVVGQERAMGIAVNNSKRRHRVSRLGNLLA